MADPQPDQPPESGAPKPRPDWLLDAQQDILSELGGPRPVSFEIKRPDADMPNPQPRPAPDVVPPQRRAPSPESPDASATPRKSWVAAASSVPRLVHVRPSPAGARPDQASDPEQDSPETRPVEAPPKAPLRIAPAAVLKPLQEPWWIVWIEKLATDRKLQAILLGATLAIVAAVVFWPRGERGVALNQIKRHPEAYEGRPVRIHGRIGEVFPMGQGYVFNLHQGRDTVVVFTRSRVPVSRNQADIVGTVSTGYLDGVARVAVLENASR